MTPRRIHYQLPEEPRACHPGRDRRSRRSLSWSSNRPWWRGRTFWYETQGEAATTPPQPPLATSPAVKQTSLPDLLAHGQQRTRRQRVWPSSPAISGSQARSREDSERDTLVECRCWHDSFGCKANYCARAKRSTANLPMTLLPLQRED